MPREGTTGSSLRGREGEEGIFLAIRKELSLIILKVLTLKPKGGL
jgi:hypothetical protein